MWEGYIYVYIYLTVILRGRAGYELIYITNEAVGRVGYYHLICGKSEKNNCFSKFSSNSLDFIGWKLRYRLLESCYTRQRFSVILEAVVSSAAILSWNKTSHAQKEQFDWPMPVNVATQVAGKVLHCATWEKFLATLRNALRKVELTSTFRNDCGNKKIATNAFSRVCYTRQYFLQLVSQQNWETSCKRNCLV